jgi:hypothetical protein
MAMPEKAILKSEQQGVLFECLINPAELTISKSNSWQAPEKKGGNTHELRFQSGQPGTMTFNMVLDSTEKGEPVTKYTDKLLELMKVDPTLKGSDPKRNKGRPPWVEFHWGALHSFKAVIERLQIKFTYFGSSGKPLRAKVDITLKQFDDREHLPLQNPTSHTATLHTMHRVVHGETLDRIAATHYADSTRWRLIADANAVVDPLEVPAGTLLVIPEIPVRRRG